MCSSQRPGNSCCCCCCFLVWPLGTVLVSLWKRVHWSSQLQPWKSCPLTGGPTVLPIPCLRLSMIPLQVTIVPRGSGALGYAQYLPKEVRMKKCTDDMAAVAWGRLSPPSEHTMTRFKLVFCSSALTGCHTPLYLFDMFSNLP